jgi:hypothetical protein
VDVADSVRSVLRRDKEQRNLGEMDEEDDGCGEFYLEAVPTH